MYLYVGKLFLKKELGEVTAQINWVIDLIWVYCGANIAWVLNTRGFLDRFLV